MKNVQNVFSSAGPLSLASYPASAVRHPEPCEPEPTAVGACPGRKNTTIRKITTSLISLTVAFLSAVIIAPPGNAASGGSYCFLLENGNPFVGPAFVQVSADGISDWYDALSMQTDGNGCGAFTLSGSYTGMYVRVTGEYAIVGNLGEGALVRWSGTTPLNGLPGDMEPYLGTGIVYCQPFSLPC